MSNMTTVEISRKILETLQSNPTLSEYVKSFSIGGIDASRKQFPFVTVEAPKREANALTIGRNGFMNNTYTIRIFGGTYHTLPDVAHAGDDNGKKGIIQLNADLLNAVIPCNFNDTFAGPVTLLQASTAHKAGSGGSSWMTIVVLSGRLRTRK